MLTGGMGNKQGTLGHHLETASKTGASAFPDKKLESFPDDLTKVSAVSSNKPEAIICLNDSNSTTFCWNIGGGHEISMSDRVLTND